MEHVLLLPAMCSVQGRKYVLPKFQELHGITCEIKLQYAELGGKQVADVVDWVKICLLRCLE